VRSSSEWNEPHACRRLHHPIGKADAASSRRKKEGNHVRKSLSLILLLGLPAVAQVTGGHETVQDAIRFERQKDAADARQARIEARGGSGPSADRQDNRDTVRQTSQARKHSASRNSRNSQTTTTT